MYDPYNDIVLGSNSLANAVTGNKIQTNPFFDNNPVASDIPQNPDISVFSGLANPLLDQVGIPYLQNKLNIEPRSNQITGINANQSTSSNMLGGGNTMLIIAGASLIAFLALR